jgi:hypothetical protein
MGGSTVKFSEEDRNEIISTRDYEEGERKVKATRNVKKLLNKIELADTKMVKDNKFYVGSHSALERDWGHATLEAAVAHAEELLDASPGREFTFVVQIVRIVKRRRVPVTVVKVK